jgi:hypothetical protein
MNRAIRIASLLALTAGLQGVTLSATAQTVYKSVDEQGNVTFTDRPPANQQVEAVEGLDIQSTDTLLVAAQNSDGQNRANAQDAVKQVRREQDGEAAGIEAQDAGERAANCEIAQGRFKKYAEARRLYKSTAEGEREYLTDAELDSARENAAMSVEEWCD